MIWRLRFRAYNWPFECHSKAILLLKSCVAMTFKRSVICSKSKSSNHYVIRIIAFRCQVCVAFMQSLYFNNSCWYTKSLTFGLPRVPSTVPRFRRNFPSQLPFLIQLHPQELGVHIHLLWPNWLLQQIINAHHFSTYNFKGMGVYGLNKLFILELRIQDWGPIVCEHKSKLRARNLEVFS